MKHLISAADLTDKDIREIFERASKFRSEKSGPMLQGRVVCTAFFENSTRTKLSFEHASRKLGAQVLNFSPSTSSVQKGESLRDSLQTLEAIGADLFVIRHSSSGAASFAAQTLSRPVINAGDGTNEHPTQALLDAFTLTESLGTLTNKKILIIGDVLHSRVAKSNFRTLKTLGAQVWVCGPGSLMPRDLSKWVDRVDVFPEKVLTECDAVMCLRVQTERAQQIFLPSLREYRRFWGLTNERFAMLKSNAVVLDPGPVVDHVQIEPEVRQSDRVLILHQVQNGVWIRMAVLDMLLGNKK